MLALEVKNLSLKLGHRRLVTGLNWQVRQGEFWCVLGRNGAGKSTLLHALSGLQSIDDGSVWMMGRSVKDLTLTELARLRGLMPQQIVDRFSASVGDTVAIARTPWRLGSAWRDDDDRSYVTAALQRVGMLERIDDDVMQLSGGERQRVAFAAMLVQNPALMLLDEPSSHQDIAQQLVMMRLMQELAVDHAVIASCHDINLAARFASHVLLLGEGFHYAGSTQEMLNPEVLSRVYGCEFDTTAMSIVAV
ncbi:MAG: ABC transporter ATP-binding protein [Burkholderiaceae bacterium]